MTRNEPVKQAILLEERDGENDRKFGEAIMTLLRSHCSPVRFPMAWSEFELSVTVGNYGFAFDDSPSAAIITLELKCALPLPPLCR